MKILSSLVTLLALATASLNVMAEACTAGAQCLPEPGSLALLGVGAAVGALIWARDRKNKK